ncbi:patatin-like phospholipase family protein [Proteus sp. CD3]|uniref:patatin-like phospholipase family protein n=1 Tax=Proteus sp. CD3 TaxID=1921565 RepID=UPI00124ACC4E|nr:patatin-like phospholipase family protein [Proteus sp. CD3]QEZ93395.1 patatin family protein [Proteus sp. CD3]
MGKYIPVTLNNITALEFQSSLPQGKVALVCEGGGQRGIFTAGVLDEFMRSQFDPFDILLGVSAGAQNLSAFACGQRGYARKIINRYTTNNQFFNPIRFVRGGNLLDLDWYIDTTAKEMPLDIPTALRRFDAGREFYMVASRSDNFQANYFQPDEPTWLDIIKASSAIPAFYRNGVLFHDVVYHDGGISDAIPVREAYRRGCRTIVVVRTVPSEYQYTTEWVDRMGRWFENSRLQRFMEMAQIHIETYTDTIKFIQSPPEDVVVIEIYPPTTLQSSALGSRLNALNHDYHVGRRCGRYFLATIGQHFAKKKFKQYDKKVFSLFEEEAKADKAENASIIQQGTRSVHPDVRQIQNE